MTYIAGGNIQAADYNTFATGVAGMNELFADANTGATTLPNAGYGYGQTALSSVSVGDNISAPEWNSLFTAMRSTSIHQTNSTASVVPPLPATGPVALSTVIAVTDSTTMSGLITTLRNNRFVVDSSQLSLVLGTGFSNPSSWSSELVYTFQVDFGSWDNARYFFNAGSVISITGVYTPAPTPDEIAWATLFADDFPVNFNWQRTNQPSGNLIVNQPGFYQDPSNPVLYPGLTTVYQPIYQKYAGASGPYYATNYALIEAKLANAAGTNGRIDFRITLVDDDALPIVKAANRMTFTVNRVQSAGAVPYAGGYTYVSGGFVAT